MRLSREAREALRMRKIFGRTLRATSRRSFVSCSYLARFHRANLGYDLVSTQLAANQGFR